AAGEGVVAAPAVQFHSLARAVADAVREVRAADELDVGMQQISNLARFGCCADVEDNSSGSALVIDKIETGSTDDLILRFLLIGDECVISLVAIECVRLKAGVNRVVATSAGDVVAPAVAEQLVISLAAGDGVVALAAVNDDRELERRGDLVRARFA